LDRFGAAVDEEDVAEPLRREGGQPRGGALAHRERQRVGLEEELAGLEPERAEQARVAVAEQRRGVAAVEGDELAAVDGLEARAAAAGRLELELVVDRQQRGGGGVEVERGEGHGQLLPGPFTASRGRGRRAPRPPAGRTDGSSTA